MTDFPMLLSPELAPIWRAVHARLSSGRPVSRVRVGPLGEDERVALADLLGLDRLPGEPVSVSLARLDQILRDSVGAGVDEVVTAIVGPLEDRAGRRAQAVADRAELWAWLAGHDAVRAQPALAEWCAAVQRGGLIGGSVASTRRELDRALRVLAQLPATGVPLPMLADQVLLDPHALDEQTRCSRLVLRALAEIYSSPAPVDAQQRRALWERAGVADDELSPVVLAAGIRPVGDDVGAQVLRACVEAGQAASLTLAQVRAAACSVSAPELVAVVENPSVMALALARFGQRCPPMVCTAGWPNSAGILLLRKLAEAGARLRYHGDFDGEGIRIAATVLARTGAQAWRMSAQDYLAALDGLSAGPPVGRVTEAPWDADLATLMRGRGIAVTEERVAIDLLEELADTA